jgi:hypothetical protein
MSLLGYSQGISVSLQSWEQAMQQDRRWKLILRNFDRECDRSDIDKVTFDSFLIELAAEWTRLTRTQGPVNPTAAIDTVIGKSRTFYLLPGKALNAPAATTQLYRYMRLDHFWKYNLPNVALSSQSSRCRMNRRLPVLSKHC